MSGARTGIEIAASELKRRLDTGEVPFLFDLRGEEAFAAWRIDEATLDLFRMSRETAQSAGRNVKFLFPSSIAVYGLPDAGAKEKAGAVREEDWIRPSSMYGCNKVYCEMVGAYYSRRAIYEGGPGLDFRAIRFPGLISA